MFLSENLQEKWSPILEHSDLPKIEDNYKRAVTAVILENQEKALNEDRATLEEAAPLNATGSAISNWDPILISLVRRAMPNLVAYDICGVQPMTGPTGLIFAMKARYHDDVDATRDNMSEALFNEARSKYSSEAQTTSTSVGSDPIGDPFDTSSPSYADTTGSGMSTANAESLGDAAGNHFAEMAFTIEKATVTAKSRALKAEYTLELAQDLKAIHGLDAESELANILSSEILAEINREVIRNVNLQAKTGAAATASAGTFNLDVDANGRWSVEKFKGLIFQIEREANVIAKETRRGKGNFILCSSDVASALSMAGVLDYAPALSTSLNVDDTGNTFAGVLQGKYRVYIDPFAANVAATQYYVMGYKGSSPYDAGLFYCPYVPLQMVRAVGQDTFQPKIGFKTRYGMVENPFSQGTTQGLGTLTRNTNRYYRRVKVSNLM